jgi:hypothetical protein
MKQQTIILLSSLLIAFTITGNAATSGGSGGGVIIVGTSPESFIDVTLGVQPGDWTQSTGLEKRSLSTVNGSAAAGNASANASADVPRGVLSAFANAGNEPLFSQSAVAMANTSFRDKITVVSSGTSNKAVLYAKLTGIITPGLHDETFVVDYATFALGVVTGSGLQRIDGLFTAKPFSFCNPVIDGYPRDCVAGDTPTYQTEIAFDLPSDGETFQVFGTLFAQATNGAVIDFNNGFNFWLEVPENTVLQSPTGFLVTPVPEPETYTLLFAGLGLLGVVARRNKQVNHH